MRTYIYVDGLNLYYRALRGSSVKWLDLVALFNNVLQEHHKIVRVKYFTTKVSGTPQDPYVQRRQEIYLRALRHYRPEVEIYFGQFLKNRVMMPLADPTPKERFAEVLKTEEKGSDVSLAVHLVNDSWKNCYDCAVVVTNDSDMAEGMRLVRKEHPKKRIGLATPGRKRATNLLREHAHFTLRLYGRALRHAQMPTYIPGTTLRKPSSW